MKQKLTGKAAVWLSIVGLILFVLGANAHLLYVAIASQPDCVMHQAPGSGEAGTFSAAQSNCSPPAEGKSQ
jgi:hypothetical protein